MIRIVAGPPDLTFIVKHTEELLSLSATWRDPQTKKADKATTVAAVGEDMAAAEAWLTRAVARLSEHIATVACCRVVVEC